jgi:hypothetical protein
MLDRKLQIPAGASAAVVHNPYPIALAAPQTAAAGADAVIVFATNSEELADRIDTLVGALYDSNTSVIESKSAVGRQGRETRGLVQPRKMQNGCPARSAKAYNGSSGSAVRSRSIVAPRASARWH